VWIPKIDTRQSDLFEQWLPYWEWEEVQHSMWSDVQDRKAWLAAAVEFTGDAELYGAWMLRVVDMMPKSCMHNLSKRGDKRSWIGHAAVALAIKCPEDIVRQAWALLSAEQQARANEKAAQAINYWRSKHA
jgi:hypothetical protein